jgi:hypothetical protein
MSVRAPWANQARFWTTGLVLLGLALRLYHYLRDPSMWHDEAALVVNVLGKSFAELLGPLFYAEAAPPLFLWLEKAVTQFLGDGTYALRLLPFLASCASLLLMVPIAKRLLSPSAVPWALLIFACSDHLLWHSCEAKPYAVDVFAATLTIALFCLTDSWPLGYRLLLCAVIAPCLIFLVYPGCFLCGGLLVSLLPRVVRSGNRTRWLGYALLTWAVFASFAVLVVGPIHAQRCERMNLCWVDCFPAWDRPWSIPLWTLMQSLNLFSYCCEPLGQGYALLAGIGGFCLWRRGLRSALVLLVLPILLALFASFVKAYPYDGSRVLIYAAPALVLLVAEGVAPCLKKLLETASQCAGYTSQATLARIGSAALVVYLVLPLGRALQRVLLPWPRADCAGAASFVWTHRRSDEPVAGNHWEYAYYFRDLGSSFILLDGKPFPHTQRLWVVITGLEPTESLGFANHLTPGGWQVRQQHKFERTSVFFLSREDGPDEYHGSRPYGDGD